MVIYWDAVMLFNFLVDYLLLYGAMRLAGRDIGRRRLLLGAALGALYAAVQLLLPRSIFLMVLVFLAIGALSFYGSGRAIKLTLLFLMLSCAFAGGVLLLGQLGGTERLGRGILSADLPWGVFFAAAGLTYLLLSFVFRGGARYSGGELAKVTISYRGESVTLTLLRDTGNQLTDPQTGDSIPVVSESALRRLIGADEVRRLPQIPYCCVGTQGGYLPVLRCDELRCDGVSLGARLIAISENVLGGGRYVGLWCGEEASGLDDKDIAVGGILRQLNAVGDAEEGKEV